MSELHPDSLGAQMRDEAERRFGARGRPDPSWRPLDVRLVPDTEERIADALERLADVAEGLLVAGSR